MRDNILGRIDKSSVVIDVGGGAAPSVRADWVVDALSYDERGKLLGKRLETGDWRQETGGGRPHRKLRKQVGRRVTTPQASQAGRQAERVTTPQASQAGGQAERVTRETWVQLDLCARERWPFEDNQFDFALCTHVLEDLRDPIWVCSEISRIAKAGSIEVPSRVEEQSLGVEHPRYAGYYHHRWLVSENDGALEFRFKPHNLHALKDAIVTGVGPWRKISSEHANLCFEWQGEFAFKEVLEFDEAGVKQELCEFAKEARRLPELTVPTEGGFVEKMKRQVYYWRLGMQG